jgi:(2Fe-2S) ferredoxin
MPTTPSKSRFSKHVFVCTNRRGGEGGKGCCASKGGEELLIKMKDAAKAAGLGRDVRINRAGCLGQCARGIAAVVYPEGVWYGALKVEDADTIVAEHLVAGRPVERLLLKDDINA